MSVFTGHKGKSWKNLDGGPLKLPVVADDGGPADRITLDDEFESHTWLSSFLVKGGKTHFTTWRNCSRRESTTRATT